MDQPVERKELKSGWKNEVEVPTSSLTDVAKHNTKQDLWIVIHGRVYDVTDYVRDHPGGPDALLEVAGMDATSAYEDIGHSEDAREIMQQYLVAVLAGAQSGDAAQQASTPVSHIVRRGPSEEPEKPKAGKFVLGLEVAGCAVGAVGLIWLGAGTHLFGPFGHGSFAKAVPASGSFTQGFLLATTTCGIAGLLGAKLLSSKINIGGSDFRAFPAHKPGSQSVPSARHPSGVISSSEYRKFALRSKRELSPGIWHFVLDLPTSWAVLGLPIGQHIAVRGQVDDQTVTRSYTPISNNSDLGRLQLLIRIYPDGQLGKYMSALQAGDLVDVRGPKGAMRYRKGMSRHIGMIGGGTGITPLYQLIRAICEDKSDETRISLVYGNRSESDVLLREQMDAFAKASGGRFSIHYTLDHPEPGWTGGTGHITKQLMQEHLPAPASDTKILLCGPPGLVNASIKSLVDLGFEAPGAVSKMNDQVFCF